MQESRIYGMMLDPHDDSGQSFVSAVDVSDGSWDAVDQEGELLVDVVDDGTDLLVVAPMAGAVSEQIEVQIHDDVLTIRGHRVPPSTQSLLHAECFWGPFSRTVVLPVHVRGESAQARYVNGVLSVRIPKKETAKQIQIEVVEE